MRTVLVVEDNPGDALLLKMGLESEGKNDLSVRKVEDGEEALDFLYNRKQHAAAPRPALVFLDLNLPKVDGRDVLRMLKQDTQLSPIPVIVLSTSDSKADIETSYMYGANSYIVKPKNLEETLRTIALCKSYWLELVRLEGTPES